MTKTVLDVGNCAFDHADLERMIRLRFGAQVLRAVYLDEVLRVLLRSTPVDLVLVNRRLHGDAVDGIEVIRQIKADRHLAFTPVMLLSNYREYQEAAVAAGAELGFGKAELEHPDTETKLRKFLD